jgi:bifunctional non-homologous end joining protein LigD
MRHVYWALEAERNKDTRPAPAPRVWRTRVVKTEPPLWIEPQYCKAADQRPTGQEWIHELKIEGLRLAARIDHGDVQLLTRTGRDRTFQFPSIVEALEQVPVETAYIDGVLTGVEDQGVYGPGALVYHAFDLLELDGAPTRRTKLLNRKQSLVEILKAASPNLVYVDHEGSDKNVGEWAYRRGLGGVISKRTDAAYESGRNGLWLESRIARN